ncbi:MAG: DUF2065 domain-containing protein [Gammaproteobacteria bacterium]|nr:DUF2065 domain-containing protein [Gammaproteobacteria bacterium]MCP4995301.1 DUF2065 domain-containing protein [Gammaproteobacteria bacterium]
MWQELLIALALVMVIEGLLPFLSPGTVRNMVKAISEMDDHALRISGLISMVLGVVMLYLVH